MTTSNHVIKVKRNDDAVWRVIDGDVVLLIPEEATLHALTGCGSRVWELVEGETTILDIVEQICDEYEVEPGRARDEITQFIDKLIAMNLVEAIPEACKDEEVNR